jgi:hypothetical protein
MTSCPQDGKFYSNYRPQGFTATEEPKGWFKIPPALLKTPMPEEAQPSFLTFKSSVDVDSPAFTYPLN